MTTRRTAATAIAALIAGASLLALASCGSAAATVESHWSSRKSGLGIIVKQTGSEVEATMYLLSDRVMKYKDSKEVKAEFADAQFLAYGVIHPERKTMVFPLRTNTAVQIPSARKIVSNGQPYVEIDLDFSGDRITGRWRQGDKPPKMKRTFYRRG